jgi:hypothetical protein
MWSESALSFAALLMSAIAFSPFHRTSNNTHSPFLEIDSLERFLAIKDEGFARANSKARP